MATGGGSGRYVSAGQVLRRLADIEQDGVEFYEGLAEGTESDWVRSFAQKLRKAEMRHRQRFLEYAARAEAEEGENELEKPIPPEVRRLLTTRVLAPKDRIKKSAPYAQVEDALKLAVRAEEHIALLLSQLREYVAKPQRRYIDRVIKEEWGHKDSLERLLAKKSS